MSRTRLPWVSAGCGRMAALEPFAPLLVNTSPRKLPQTAAQREIAMTFSLYSMAIDTFVPMLRTLSTLLDKAAAHAEARKIAPAVLLQSRLFPDMLPLTKQVQIACDTAKMCAARLTGKTAPVHEDNETTLAQLKERIQKVLDYLATFTAADYKDAATIKVSQPRWEGKYLTGAEFAVQHAIPNLHFHIVTAYSILRHNGITIGKKDYLGDMPFKS